ncbi:MAG: HAMP domain-containing protein [Thermoleophilia bacterium]
MRHRLRASGLRVRLALALAGVAVISVALATVLANAGLDSRLRDAADARLRESARHSAALAAEIYARDRGWTRRGAAELRHLAEMNGYRFALRDRDGRTLVRAARGGDRARAPVRVGGATVGVVEVAPVGGTAVTAEDRHLHNQLNRLHLLAALLALGIGVAAAALLAPRLAGPLRRVTDVARRMQRGELDSRVTGGGGREIEQVGSALNRLAETLQREEQIRRDGRRRRRPRAAHAAGRHRRARRGRPGRRARDR